MSSGRQYHIGGGNRPGCGIGECAQHVVGLACLLPHRPEQQRADDQQRDGCHRQRPQQRRTTCALHERSRKPDRAEQRGKQRYIQAGEGDSDCHQRREQHPARRRFALRGSECQRKQRQPVDLQLLEMPEPQMRKEPRTGHVCHAAGGRCSRAAASVACQVIDRVASQHLRHKHRDIVGPRQPGELQWKGKHPGCQV